MRHSAVITVFAASLAAAPLAAQDFVRERERFGSDTLFGPGVIEVSASGAAVRLELTRAGHVLALVLTPTSVARVVEPKRNESRSTNAGKPWIDLFQVSASSSSTAASGPSMSRGASGYGGAGGSRATEGRAAANAGVAYRGAGNTVALVLVSEQPWELRLVEPALPRQPEVDIMQAARSLVPLLTQGREGGWSGYLVRY